MKRASILALFLLVPGCAGDLPEVPRPSESAAVYALTMAACPAAGSPARGADGLPELTFPCLTGAGEMTLGGTSPLPTVLNLWAPWCEPCRDELPLLDRLHAEAADVVRVTGLVEKDTLESSLAYAADAQLAFPSAIDRTGQLMDDQGLNALPVTFFLRADGSIAHREIGPITSYDELTALVQEHLAVTVPA